MVVSSLFGAKPAATNNTTRSTVPVVRKPLVPKVEPKKIETIKATAPPEKRIETIIEPKKIEETKPEIPAPKIV